MYSNESYLIELLTQAGYLNEEILQYARRNHLRLYGHAYEIGINEMVIDKIDDYITKIEIPVAYEGV